MTFNGSSEVTRAQESDSKDQSEPDLALDESPGVHMAQNRHPRSPRIVKPEVAMMAVLVDVEYVNGVVFLRKYVTGAVPGDFLWI